MMIDLHTHTTAYDGTVSPAELVALASAAGLEALAITDHDTFTGFDQARAVAAQQGVDLLCGIELSTRYRKRSTHLLGYFPAGKPGPEFNQWIVNLQRSRFDRNQELAQKLRTHGIDVSLERLRERHGDMLGRPHFAAFMVERGFVRSMQQAFDEYLDVSGCCYVQREEPPLAEAALRISQAGGLSSLAHPCRVSRDPLELGKFLAEMRASGLAAIEVYHSDHSPADVAHYSKLATEFELTITGGSDFHGKTKPGIELGTGRNGNLAIPRSILEGIRALGREQPSRLIGEKQ